MNEELTLEQATDEFLSLLNDDPDFRDLYCDTDSSFKLWLETYEITIKG